MAQHLLKTSMAKGEITPLASQRQDLELYKQGLAKLRNWFVLKHGGVRRRSGTRYRGGTKFPNLVTRLIAYTFSIGQSYALEFGNLYMRVWLPDGLVVSSGITPYELVTPYTDTQVGALQVAPYNDAIYVAHPSVYPQLIKRLLSNSWTIAPVAFVDGPYLPVNDIAANTVNVSATPVTGVPGTLTWSAGAVALTSADLNRHVRVSLSGNWSWGRLTTILSATSATVTWAQGNGGTAATVSSWRLGAFYIGNYPGSVSFFEDRLAWSGVPNTPRTVYISQSALPANYAPTDALGVVADSNGFYMEINRSDPILWLKESSRLQLGTESGIRSIGGLSGAALTAKNPTQKLEVKVGATGIVPEQAGYSTIFAGRTGRRLNKMYYDYQVNGLVAPELSILSEHLFKQGIVAMAYQETPDSILWSIDALGNPNSTTLEQSEDINGFSAHDVSGTVKSIAVISPIDRDELWMIVSRVINGSTVQYVETLEKPYDEDVTLPANAFMVDCGATYSGAATNTVSGLGFLALKTVQLLADGARLPDVIVSAGGTITLPNARLASTIQIGLPIPNSIVTLEAPAIAQDGATVGRRKRVFGAIVKMLSSQGVQIGALGQKAQLLAYRNAASLLGQALPLNTGTFKTALDDTYGNAAQVEVSVVGPFPATVLALNIDVESEP